MKIKKYQANSETEAMNKIKEELGMGAVILNVKKIQPKGLFKFFKQQYVEVTAAVDENITYTKETAKANVQKNDVKKDSEKEDNVIEYHKADKQYSALVEQLSDYDEAKTDEISNDNKNSKIGVVKLIYNNFINNEVAEEYANQLINEIENAINRDESVDNILGGLYQKIVLKFGKIHTIKLTEGKTKYVFFIGPTGVGKTTTIAKLASNFKLIENKKVGFITADTYRIAAVEQLRTYGNILNIPTKVIYSEEELEDALIDFDGYDLVLIDTAGRSHKNTTQCDNINSLLKKAGDNKEVYLVLSATTKYRDLVKITETYSNISEYRIIFTKLDETSSYGNIFNIKMLTGADLSYVTFGQNVPKDISELNSQKMAKHLLGGTEV